MMQTQRYKPQISEGTEVEGEREEPMFFLVSISPRSVKGPQDRNAWMAPYPMKGRTTCVSTCVPLP